MKMTTEIKKKPKCLLANCDGTCQIDYLCNNCELYVDGYGIISNLKDALAYIQQLEAAAPKWISVEERLPEESDAYVTWSKYGRKVLIYHAGLKKWGSVWIGEFDIHVTHWMPLPEPPKKET